MHLTRREFVATGSMVAAAGITGGASGAAAAAQSAPVAKPDPAARGGSVLVSSANGLRTVARAFDLIQSGTHPLDAVVTGINIVEDDPSDNSVGYGGLPNEDGVVQLDACVMDGPTHRSGAVACLERIKNPSSVALLVSRRTDHCLLVGDGALRFARAHGFQEMNLLTEEARLEWIKWKESHSSNDAWISPESPTGAATWERRDGVNYTTGTITCLARTKDGDLFGCTSTSGLSWKIPGRVGDSPIIGAGLYVDNEFGAAGSTGRGEANIQTLASYNIVEMMGRGMPPEDACLEQLRRIAKRTEKRLRNAAGEPKFGLTFYAIRKDGMVGGATMRESGKMSVRDASDARHVPLKGLYSA